MTTSAHTRARSISAYEMAANDEQTLSPQSSRRISQGSFSDASKNSLVGYKRAPSVVEQIESKQRETLDSKISTMRNTVTKQPAKKRFRMPTLVISKGTPMLCALTAAQQRLDSSRASGPPPSGKFQHSSGLVSCPEEVQEESPEELSGGSSSNEEQSIFRDSFETVVETGADRFGSMSLSSNSRSSAENETNDSCFLGGAERTMDETILPQSFELCDVFQKGVDDDDDEDDDDDVDDDDEIQAEPGDSNNDSDVQKENDNLPPSLFIEMLELERTGEDENETKSVQPIETISYQKSPEPEQQSHYRSTLNFQPQRQATNEDSITTHNQNNSYHHLYNLHSHRQPSNDISPKPFDGSAGRPFELSNHTYPSASQSWKPLKSDFGSPSLDTSRSSADETIHASWSSPISNISTPSKNISSRNNSFQENSTAYERKVTSNNTTPTGTLVQSGAGSDGKILDFVIKKGPFSLGFCIEGGKGSPLGNRPIRVKRLFKGDTTVQGLLEAGDIISSVNDHPLEGMSHLQAWNFLKECSEDTMYMRVIREES